jgi:hypothetical protein
MAADMAQAEAQLQPKPQIKQQTGGSFSPDWVPALSRRVHLYKGLLDFCCQAEATWLSMEKGDRRMTCFGG